MSTDGTGSADRIAGVSLIVAAVLTVFTMGHHPSGAHGGGLLGAIVHGTMIALLAAILFGFSHFAQRRGLGNPLVLAGLIAYAISAFAHFGAALINGFIAPAMAAHGAKVGHDILILCWEANQALAKLGVVATGLAFLLWSIDLLRRGTGFDRIVGIVGLLAGLLPALALTTGRTMDVPTAFAIYATHAAWTILLGVHLLRRAPHDRP